MNAAPRRRRALLQSGLTLLACVLMVASAYLFRLMDNPYTAGYAALVMLLGGAALVGARRLAPQLRLAHTPTQVTNRPPRALPVAFGMALMALLMAVSNDNLAYLLSLALSARLQFLLLVAAVALITWGMAGMPRPRLPRLERREAALLGAILLAALALRLWNLENSLRVFVDELHLSTGTAYFWGQHHPRLLQSIGVLMPFPRIFPYWMSEAVEIFGRNFTGLRFTSAIIGTLTIAATYFMARQFFNRRTSLAGATLLATFPPFLHFSRIALINIADPLFGALAVGFLARAVREGRHSDYALAGMALGLTQYFYEGGKLLIPALVLLWLAGMALGSLRVTRRLYAWFTLPFSREGVMVMAITALLIGLPVVVVMVSQTTDIHPRMTDAGLNGDFWQKVVDTGDVGLFIERIDNPFLVYTRLPDEARYYGGSTPLILPFLVPLFLLGLVHALAWRERRGAWVLVAWVVLTSLGNSLLMHSTIAARFIIVLPVLGLLMALGLMATLDLLLPRANRLRGGLAIALLLVISVLQAGYYFGPHLTEFNQQSREREGPDGHDALLRTADFPPETAIHLISAKRPFTNQYGDQLGAYVADEHEVHVVTRDEFTHAYMLGLSRNIDQAFFVEPDDTQSVALIRQYFPVSAPQTTPYADVIPPEKAMVLYYYSAGG